MHETYTIQNWIAKLDRRTYALFVGLTIGIIGGTIGLMLAVLGPVVTIGAVFRLARRSIHPHRYFNCLIWRDFYPASAPFWHIPYQDCPHPHFT